MHRILLGPVLFQKVVYSLFIFFILYSNFDFEKKKKKYIYIYIYKHSFSHLIVFGKLYWIHNLGIEYITSHH